MNTPPHDPLLCGLDWESTCEHCRTMFPQYVSKAAPTKDFEEFKRSLLSRHPKEFKAATEIHPIPETVWVGLDYDEITERSPLAFKILCSDGRALWIPLSQIENNGAEYGVGFKNGTILVTAWIARQKCINEGSQ